MMCARRTDCFIEALIGMKVLSAFIAVLFGAALVLAQTAPKIGFVFRFDFYAFNSFQINDKQVNSYKPDLNIFL